MTDVPSRNRTRTWFAILVPTLFFVALTAWAFSTPLGSSPDDDFHLPSIWCGLGEREGLCEASSDPDTRLVPVAFTEIGCFAFDSTASAECLNTRTEPLAEVDRVNLGLYPPLFYGTMSFFASEDIQLSVLVIRVFNSALIVGLLTATFWALPRRVRPALLISAIGACVPLGLSVVASTNPSSWAYASAAVVWAALYGATQVTGRRQLVLAALALIAGVMGAGARADAAAYAVVAVGVAAVMGLRPHRQIIIPMVAAIGVVIAAVIFYLFAGQTDNVTSGFPGGEGAPPLGLDGHFSNLINIPSLWTGALGGWALGWFDTPMPAVVWVFSVAVACGVLFIGVKHVTRRRWIAIGLVGAVLWVAPLVLLAQSNALVGSLVQPRYILPLLVLFLAVVSASDRTEAWWRGPRSFVAAGALTLAMAVALHTNIRRYTTGLDDLAMDPGSRAEWWWTGAPSPLTFWIVGVLAFAVALLLCGIGITRIWRLPAANDQGHSCPGQDDLHTSMTSDWRSEQGCPANEDSEAGRALR